MADQTPMHDRPNRHRGFTLIELLVVVSIIALLIGILMPSLAGARRQARTVFCLANLSQLGVAMQLYADRNGEYVPQIWGGPIAWGEKKGVLYRLVVTSGVMPEADEFPKVLVCPEARPRGSISYALNAVLFGYQHPSPTDDPDDPDDDVDELAGLNVPPLQLSTPRHPAKVVALYDVRVESLARVWGEPVDADEADISDQFTANAAHGWAGVVEPNPAGFMWQRSARDPSIETDPPHGRGHNILFADIHAATHTAWNPDKMTRLSGWEPNDSLLH